MFKPEYASDKVREFGIRIKKERQKQSLNQKWLAKKASVNTQTIKRIESGENSTLVTIFKVARALDTDLGSMIQEIYEEA
jgi:DNA-binding XRE family transcriptional regulator